MTDKPTEALLPCPFCGNDERSPIESIVQLHHNEYDREHNPSGDWWTVQCDHCTATMGQFPNPDEAITAWNTRSALPVSQPSEGEVLLKELRGLAETLHRRFYWDVPQWQPLDTARGILSQIDNMVAGIAMRLDEAEVSLAAIPLVGEVREVVERLLDRADVVASVKRYYVTGIGGMELERDLREAADLLSRLDTKSDRT